MHLLRTTSTSLLGATLIATAAAAQDQRLDRLDPRVRPLVASVIDSARAAGLPTESLVQRALEGATKGAPGELIAAAVRRLDELDRKSTRLNSSHGYISYAGFCLKQKKGIRRTA